MTLKEQWDQYRRETCQWCREGRFQEIGKRPYHYRRLGGVGALTRVYCTALPYPDWLERRVGELERQLAGWKVCNTCGGSPHPSGAECICGGTGSAIDELNNLRVYAVKVEQERDSALADAKRLREALVEIRGWVNEKVSEDIDGSAHRLFRIDAALAATPEPNAPPDAPALPEGFLGV